MKVLIMMFVLAFLGPFKSLNAKENTTSQFHLFSMGTLWKIDLYHPIQAINKEIVKSILNKHLLHYDQTFSDWSPTSELRKLEKGMTNWVTPTPLFMKGLEYSKEAFDLTQKKFDITIGAVLWKESLKPVGLEKMRLRKKENEKQFKFLIHPKRLTFGGNVKGMALGKLSRVLRDLKIKNFRIDAGGGNLSVMGQKNSFMAWEEEAFLGPLKGDEIAFISRSKRTRPNGKKHIFSRTKKEGDNKKDKSVLFCKSTKNKIENWERLASLSDAFSTVQTFSNYKLPKSLNCKNL